jgi:hypothetical protein
MRGAHERKSVLRRSSRGSKYGVGFGSALAIAISYTANHSILWAIIHGIFGWLYVIYFALFRS